MKSTTIPRVEIEIGENLYLRIENVSFLPRQIGYIGGRPEDCYPDEPAECDWQAKNAKLIYKEKKCDMTYTEMIEYRKANRPFKYKTIEHEFTVDDNFFYLYYETIIETIENMEDDR